MFLENWKMEFKSAAVINMPGSEVDVLRDGIDEMLLQVNQLEQRVQQLEQFYSGNIQKHLSSSKASKRIQMQKEDAKNMESDASKRMQELLRQFGTILNQITRHRWAWPFMEPVDVKGLRLDDYYEVIGKPMDLGTIKKQLKAKDARGYKHVWEACADVRLVFNNAMKYNGEKQDAHVMAKTLLAKFEEKWLQLLPKVMGEEKRLAEEETEVQLNLQLAQESPCA